MKRVAKPLFEGGHQIAKLSIFLIQLSGADGSILDSLPTERPRFIGLGVAILTSAFIAALSIISALHRALSLPLWASVSLGLIWAVTLLFFDRLTVISVARVRHPRTLFITALPRLLLAFAVSLFVATPIVLQTFSAEVDARLRVTHDGNSLLAQLQALSYLRSRSATLQIAIVLLYLLFTMISLLPLSIRILLNFGPISAYEIAVRSREEQGGLPDFSRLLDALHMQSVDPYTVISSWQAGGSTSAVIGEAKAGPFRIYLGRYEAHMLIGGALGSGKSELLQTIVASLAATNRPDSVTFLLMDDEGGSTFQDCARLPHTVGVITDLAEHQADRVMQSLSAELARREYAKSAGRLTQLPKLLILVDEFAAMGNSASEFIVGLIDIYRRGRSLGIHLVLASRYSLDLIPAEIRANAGLRIAMRAESKSDSVEVIQADNAAYIAADTPGRAYVRAGSDLPTPIQVSRISGCRPDSGLDDSVSDLQVLIEAINEASDHLGILPQHRPWLPPLPKTLVLGELREDGELPASYELGQLRPVCYGLSDYPKDQAQRAAVIDFATFGHMMAVGTAGSGKSQLLRTIAASIAAEHSCADVHIYVLDGGNGRLAQVAELPHCGAVVTPAQTERTTRLIGRLSQEIGLRQELLARGGFETIGDQRAAASPDQRLPHIFLFLDSWDLPASLFRQMDEDAFASTVNEFLAYGANLGMHLIVTGNQAPVTKRVARMIKDKLIFRLEDGADYGRVGLRSARPVSYLTAGRAFHAASGVETQVALLNGEPGEAGQVAALRALASMVQQRDASVGLSRRPFQVDVLALVGDRFHVGDARGRPIGREDILAWLRDRHLSGASVALLGPRRAGKTWVLAELKRRLVDDGYTRVNHVVVPQPNSSVDTPDALASVIEREVRPAASPAETLLDEAKSRAGVGGDRLVYLLDEVGRLVDYAPAAVSWLRDLGQAGAWLVYTGTEKDWHKVVRWTLRAPGSSFGNDVNARPVGPISNHAALTFLTGTAANLRVNLAESTATEIVELIGSWPFYLQVVGDAVVREVQADDLQPLTDRQALTRLIQRRLLDEWTHHFQGRWEEIGRPGRAALLTRPGAAPESLSPAQRDDLRDVGLLRPGDEWLNDPPFFNWIARNVASLQDGEHQR